MKNKSYYVYILTNKIHTVLYIGVTNNLIKRIYEHKNKFVKGFTEKYNINKLVYYEVFEDPKSAILREKQLKHWKRQWKLDLIKQRNPGLEDLYEKLL